MADHDQRISDLLQRATATGDPMAALQALTGLRHQLDLVERDHVAHAPPNARTALQRARQEAARHGAQSIESEHLLVAVARTGILSLDIEAAPPQTILGRL